MRLAFPSAIIAFVASASTLEAATDDVGESHGGLPSEDTAPVSNGRECDLGTSTDHVDSRNSTVAKPDLGMLSRCSDPTRRQVCVPDGTSSMGGRCRDEDSVYGWAASPRHLRSSSIVCEQDCSNIRDCSSEIFHVCVSYKFLPECWDPDRIPFYSKVHCRHAACFAFGYSEQRCACDYARDDCKLYADPDQCAIADCCEAATGSQEKSLCLAFTSTEDAGDVDFFLMSGQSNMHGHTTSGESLTSDDAYWRAIKAILESGRDQDAMTNALAATIRSGHGQRQDYSTNAVLLATETMNLYNKGLLNSLDTPLRRGRLVLSSHACASQLRHSSTYPHMLPTYVFV